MPWRLKSSDSSRDAMGMFDAAPRRNRASGPIVFVEAFSEKAVRSRNGMRALKPCPAGTRSLLYEANGGDCVVTASRWLPPGRQMTTLRQSRQVRPLDFTTGNSCTVRDTRPAPSISASLEGLWNPPSSRPGKGQLVVLHHRSLACKSSSAPP